jgi:hypothetical protein
MATSLKRVQAERKKIKKAHPNMDNATALKLAWKKARGGRVSGVRKTAHKKKVAPKRRIGKTVVRRTITKTVSGIGAIKKTARKAKDDLDKQLGAALVRQYNATKKTAKRKIGKQVSEIKKKIASVKRIINN